MNENSNSNEKTVKKLSLYGQEEENNIQRMNTFEGGIAFSLGSKVLRVNPNENEQIKSLFIVNKNIKNKLTIRSKDLMVKEQCKSPKPKKRHLIKTNAKFKSEVHLNKYTHKRRNSLYLKLNENEEDKSLKIIIDIYKNFDDNYESKIIKKLKEVDKCSILKYGIKPSNDDIIYSYCLTCDSSLINPICEPCLNHCHKDHIIKEKYEKGQIICSCGERSHIILNIGASNLRKDINKCLLNEWGQTSKLNICYINNNSKIKSKEIICMLCYNICIEDKNNYSPFLIELKDGETFPPCICNNKKVHNDFRFFLNLIEKMTSNYQIYEGLNLMHPTQFLNSMINSKKSFTNNCDNFLDLYNTIKNNTFLGSAIHYSFSKVDFRSTNCFLIMKSILNIISFNSHSNISYYSQEIENFFSLEIIQNLIENIKDSKLKEKSIWNLSYNYIKLFRKVYLGNKTQIFNKYKLDDLDNFPSCLRFSLFYNIEKQFNESEKIISFFLQLLQEINLKGFTCVEALTYLEEIFGVLKKLANFYLISNGDIIRVLQEIEKMFINLNILRNSVKISNKNRETYKIVISTFSKQFKLNNSNRMKKPNNNNSLGYLSSSDNDNNSNNGSDFIETPGIKLNENNFYEEELPLYYTIIKLLRIFYFNYNDRLVHNIVIDSIKYPNNNNLFNNKNISFGYMKNDFGRELFKATIKILFIVYKYNKIKEKDNLLYQNIFYHGKKILEYSLMKKDSYIISLIKSLINGEFYEKKINSLPYYNYNNKNEINNDNNELNLLIQEKNKLEISNQNFLNFKINTEELINNYINSLDNILNKHFKDLKIIGFKENILISILKSKYFFTLSKIYRIFYYFKDIISKRKNCKDNAIELIYSPEKIHKEKILINELTNKILFFYNNFIFHSTDNSLLVLSHYIFNDLTKIPIKFGEENFLLFHSCLENISESNVENILNNSSHYLKNLFEYLLFLYNKRYNKINECLLIFLKCLYTLSINIKTVDYEMLVKNIRRILFEINKTFNIAKNFFKYEEEVVPETSSKIEKENKGEISEKNTGKKSLKETGIKNNIESMNEINSDNPNEKIDINTLEQCFIIDLQLINDFFDFEISEKKEKINKLIEVHKIIYCLKFQNITHLALRTQMLRYVRKILIDMNYNKDSDYIYVKSIINNEDNLSILKNNPLVNNYKYPTKLFSFSKDFWKISMDSKANKSINQIDIKISDNLLNNNETESEFDDFESGESSSFNSEEEILENKNIDINNSKIKKVEPDEEIDFKAIKNSNNNNKSNINQKEKDKCFDSNIYDLFISELENVEDIIGDIKYSSEDEMQTLGEYFQNGLLIPIIFFLKKSFAVAHNLKGAELVKLYDLVIHTINLKITISEFKYNFWDDKNNNNYENNFDEDLFCTHMLNYKKDFLINGNIFIDNEIIKNSNKTLNTLRNKNFSCFDYTLLYSIVKNNLFNLLNEYNQNYIAELFSEKDEDLNMHLESNPFFSQNNNNSEIKQKLYKIYILYKNNKNLIIDENNSSLLNILPEICIEYGTNYRNLLIFILISNSLQLNINNKKNAFSISIYFLLYKLLSIQASKTQAEIINLLGGPSNENDNLGFILNYSKHLMKRIILLFIDIFNPKDKFYNDNYIFAISLIKIYKYLCVDHNNFFQMRLIKNLNYQYQNITPFFYKENKKIKEYKIQFSTNIFTDYELNTKNEKKPKIKNVKFFDFFLFVLIKITVISEWEGFQRYNLNNENKNIYDLFSSIIGMLNEIIQGNKEEYLSGLGNPFLNEEDNYSSSNEIDDGEESNIFSNLRMNLLYENKKNTKIEKYKKYILRKKKEHKLRIQKDPFTCFLKEMIKFIFIENNQSQILYLLRNDMMQFFTSILEEKNCNEEVQKLIIKYINIHRVFYSISNIMKNYLLYNAPLDSFPENFFPIKIDKNIDSNPLTMENYLTQKYNSIMIDKENENINENEDNKNKDEQNINNQNLNINVFKEKLIFDHRLLNYYYENYYSNKDFFTSNEFQLTNAFYKYIKLITVLGKNEEIKSIIEEVELTSINTAIKKFAPNILNIKKDPIKEYNHKDIKTQIKLSKSLNYRKILEQKKLQNKALTLESNKRRISNIFSSVQLSKFAKKATNEKIVNSVYPEKNNLASKFSLIQKINEKNSNNFKSNILSNKKSIFKNDNFEKSESSERDLGSDKKDNESSIKNLHITSNIPNNLGNKLKETLIISPINNKNCSKFINRNLENKINNENNEIKEKNEKIEKNKNNFNNENTMSSKHNIDLSTNRLNLERKKSETIKEKKRFTSFVKMKEKKNINHSLIPDNSKEYYDKDYIERFYIVKFFESITSTIEVRNEDSTNQTVIFTHLPEMIYLSNGTKAQFEQKVNRESEISKKNDLVRHLEYFHKEIEYLKNNYSSLSLWVSSINFAYISWASYIFAIILNLLALFTISGDNLLSSVNENSYDIIKDRRNDKIGIEKRINFSINKWKLINDILNYIYVVLNGFLIIIWIYFRLPLYYELEKIKFFQENTHKKTLNFRDKLYIILIMAIYNRNSINSLIYLFLVSIFSSIYKRKEIIFPFLLLAIVDLNETLKNVILSIQYRCKEFFLCFFLSCIFMYSLSNVAFFYFNSDFEQELDYYDDNICKSLIFCVLNSFDSGLRARGGIGDSAKRISFMREKNHYINRLILDDVFFFLIVIISIDLVFGIIIGEFAALREQTQKYENDMKYHCFICHINKNTIEKNRQNFSVHVNKEHNLWNYVSYMIFVKLSNVHDLNSINSYARNKIDNKDISWLPSYKDFNDNNKNNKLGEDMDDEDFRIEDENVNNAYIVKPT